MKSYFYPSLFFKKKWVWFSDPGDVSNTDMVTFFSYNNVDKEGFKKKKGLTTVIDLSQDLDILWSNMRKKFIRKQIKRGEKKGIIVKQNNDFRTFKPVYLNLRRGKNLNKVNYKVLRESGLLFLAYYKQRVIAGGVFITDGINIRAWVLSSIRFRAESGKFKEIIGQANRMVIWEAIKHAKSQGCRIFDLGGIKPDSLNKSRRAVAEFKEAFGGKRKNCYFYSKIYSRLLKSWLKFRKKIKKLKKI